MWRPYLCARRPRPQLHDSSRAIPASPALTHEPSPACPRLHAPPLPSYTPALERRGAITSDGGLAWDLLPSITRQIVRYGLCLVDTRHQYMCTHTHIHTYTYRLYVH